MSTGERVSWRAAAGLAREVVDLLEPHCERLVLAGSLRRRQDTIGDIEIVAIPKLLEDTTAQTDLFGARTGAPENALYREILTLLGVGTFARRPNVNGQAHIGPKLAWLTYKGFGLDVYQATRETWGVTLAIRTGGADFSHALVTPRPQGGLCPGYLEVKEWTVRRRDTKEITPTPEERDVFEALSLCWVEPEQRSKDGCRLALSGVLA